MKLPSIYQDLESKIISCADSGTNIIILTTPDTGGTHLTKLIAFNNSKSVKYIDSENQELSAYNLLNLNFYREPKAISVADSYFKKANNSQKIALVINNPTFIESEQFHKSFVAGHIYDTYYLGVRTKEDTNLMISELDPNLCSESMEKIYELSGGIARLIKFFSLNIEKVDWTLDELVQDKPLLIALKASVEIVQNLNNEDLIKMGYIDERGLKSEVLKYYLKIHPSKPKINILINQDLTFSEDNFNSDDRFTKIENGVLQKLLSLGVVKREEISDLKWGEGSYDKYSDQAINKTIERINKKLKKYRIISIPKLGYKIESR
jgi:hypothetical protein